MEAALFVEIFPSSYVCFVISCVIGCLWIVYLLIGLIVHIELI